jgi:hypothetical protein
MSNIVSTEKAHQNFVARYVQPGAAIFSFEFA